MAGSAYVRGQRGPVGLREEGISQLCYKVEQFPQGAAMCGRLLKTALSVSKLRSGWAKFAPGKLNFEVHLWCKPQMGWCCGSHYLFMFLLG